jgi:chondroitin AC lyase
MAEGMIMKRIIYVILALCISLSAFPVGKNKDMVKLRQKFVDELLQYPVNDEQVETIVKEIRPDGTWAGINYEDTSRIGFRHTLHLANLVQMSRAYKKKGGKLYGNREVRRAINLSLNFWLDHNFICENWWNNEIGTPNDLTSVLLVMDKDLDAEQVRRTSAITARAHINAWGARQSGDRIKIAGIQAKNALFSYDEELFAMLIRVIEGEIRFVPFDQRGLMYDYSFHHRDDKVNNTISYGLSYAETFVEWAEKVSDSPYRFSGETVKILIDYYLDGICAMMVYGKYHDPGATNRDISRRGHNSPASSLMAERLMKISGYRHDELQNIVDTRQGKDVGIRSFDRFFWLSEHYVHQRPNYYTSVRMFSSRVMNMEEPYNGEGLKNHHRGDGTNYLSLSGNEYFGITPVYDWQKIPGATIMQKPSLPPETEIQKSGAMDFVGAATDGKYGVVGFDFISPHDPIRAKKAWFFFDDEYVCLGSGISGKGRYNVVTAVDQRAMEGEVAASSSAKGGMQWVFHNNIGYIFPNPDSVRYSSGVQTGSWFDINRQTSVSRDILSMNVFKLWINHGVWPQKAHYSYIVMPATTIDKLKEAYENPKIEIIANTPDIQAVWHKELGIFQAVFYRNGSITIPDGTQLIAESPSIVMLRLKDARTITVSDPQRNHARLYFTIIKEEKKPVIIDLPQGDRAGESVSKNI